MRLFFHIILISLNLFGVQLSILKDNSLESSFVKFIIESNYQIDSTQIEFILNSNSKIDSQNLNLILNRSDSKESVIYATSTSKKIALNTLKRFNLLNRDFFQIKLLNSKKNSIEILLDSNLTSKEKIEHQVKFIDSLLFTLNINFKRNFNFFEFESVFENYGKVSINRLFNIDLNRVKSKVLYVPMRERGNLFSLSNPAIEVDRFKDYFKISIENRVLTKIYPQYFQIDKNPIEQIGLIIDGEDRVANIGSEIEFKYNFLIKPIDDGYRVNIIGFKSSLDDESNKIITVDELEREFSIDREERRYRVEIYRGDEIFSGMLTLISKGVLDE